MGTDTITLPLPTRIGEIISANFTTISGHIRITVIVALGGLVVGSVLGYAIALVATVFSKWGAGGLTIVSAFNAIPIVALAPVVNNWTRDISTDVSLRSTVAKILIVTVSCTVHIHGAARERSRKCYRSTGNGIFRGGNCRRGQTDTRKHRQGAIPYRMGIYRGSVRYRNYNVRVAYARGKAFA